MPVNPGHSSQLFSMSLLLTVNKYMYAGNKLLAAKTIILGDVIRKRLNKVQQKTMRTPTYKELYAPNFDHVIDVDKSSVDVVGPFK